jgi:hypothetical protein
MHGFHISPLLVLLNRIQDTKHNTTTSLRQTRTTIKTFPSRKDLSFGSLGAYLWYLSCISLRLLSGFLWILFFLCLIRTHAINSDCTIISRAWKLMQNNTQRHYPAKARQSAWVNVAGAMNLLCQFHKLAPAPESPPSTLHDKAQAMSECYNLFFDASDKLQQVKVSGSLESLPEICFQLGTAFRKAMTSYAQQYKKLEKERKRIVLKEPIR